MSFIEDNIAELSKRVSGTNKKLVGDIKKKVEIYGELKPFMKLSNFPKFEDIPTTEPMIFKYGVGEEVALRRGIMDTFYITDVEAHDDFFEKEGLFMRGKSINDVYMPTENGYERVGIVLDGRIYRERPPTKEGLYPDYRVWDYIRVGRKWGSVSEADRQHNRDQVRYEFEKRAENKLIYYDPTRS